MSTTTKKGKTRSGRAPRKRAAKAPAAVVPAQRKRELLGLVLMAVALLVGLAMVSYSARDARLTSGTGVVDWFDPGQQRADNALGLVGAALAEAVVPHFLGYPALGFAVLLLLWGYALFRRVPPLLPFYTVIGAVAVPLVSVFVGWFAVESTADLGLWSGSLGLGAAAWLRQVFGAAGSMILLLLGLLTTALVALDHDLQVTLDRFEELVARLRSRGSEGLQSLREARAEQAAAAATARAERRERKAAEREARAAERTAAERARAKGEAAEPKRKEEKPKPTAPPPTVSAPEPAPQRAAPEPTPAAPPPRRAVPDDEALLDALVAGHRAGTLDRVDLETGEILEEREVEPEPPAPAAPPARPAEPVFHVQGPAAPEPESPAPARAPARDVAKPPPDARRLAYDFPPLDLLEPADPAARVDMDEIEENKRSLLAALDTFKVPIAEINAVVGPTVTRYELIPAPGVKISRITALEDDLAMALAAPGIRIIAPIPGKGAIGVEIPNRKRELVRVRSILGSARFRDAGMELPVAIGKTINGDVFVEDLTKMPHLLIAGATGSGKSVGLNTLVAGLLYACHPANLKFVMIDPKKIELGPYQQLLDHFIAMPENAEDPIITDFNQAAGVLTSCEREMENRYDLLALAGVRGVRDYNRRVAEGKLDAEDGHRHLPYIVVIIDELADLMMTAGKVVEPPIARLAQMARAVGIHLVLATQRPSVDVITGLIKANFPSRVAFQVASRIDSRTILDIGGAEQLVGNGDMLYMNGSRLVRLQGPFIANDEIDGVVHHVAAQRGRGPYLLPPLVFEDGDGGHDGPRDDGERDDLFEDAAHVIVRSQQGSVSLLQRKLSVGYTRAARIVDQLEDAGVVGPFEGSKARAVLFRSEAELDAHLNGTSAPRLPDDED